MPVFAQGSRRRYTSGMSDFFLDLRDKPHVIDFLADNAEYASPKFRIDAERWTHAYEENEKIPTDKLAEAARKFAWSIWPARYAVSRYFSMEGSEEEWLRVLSAVRPSTAHLLKRFRQGTGAETLDETLNHIESDVAFKEGDRREIEEVRDHLRQEFWREKKNALGILVKEGEHLAKGYRERLDTLRELMPDFPRTMQDEVVSKIEKYQDRILFEGKAVSLEILDEEIKYYIEQKEISPSEG